MSPERLYVVDRIEAGTAVLVADEGGTVTLPRHRLPRTTQEGAVLRVPLDAAGKPLWRSAAVDEAEAARRRAEGAERLERLKKRDPGGDIAL